LVIGSIIRPLIVISISIAASEDLPPPVTL
jgi:hypothetical protein